MTDTIERPSGAAAQSLAGAPVIRAIRSMIICALIASAVYGMVVHASRGFCRGGSTGDGGYLGADGKATDAVPQCIQLTLSPSVFVFIAFGGIVLWALGAVTKRARTEAHALRILGRAMLAISITMFASVIIAFVWFFLMPVDQWDGTHAGFLFPFPFGAVDLSITPMQG